MQAYGIEALLRIFSHFTFIYLSFWAIQSLNTETFFKKINPTQIRMMLVLFAITIGYMCSSFFMETIALIKNFIIVILK